MATLKITDKTLVALAAPTATPQSYYWDTELHGFGVVVGKTGRKSFVVRSHVNGALRKVTIGVAGQPRDDKHVWNVLLARQRAKELLGQMAAGKSPLDIKRREQATGPTLRKGIELHAANMRKRGRSERSIKDLETEPVRHLEEWLDRPISELTGAKLVEIHNSVTENNGPTIANRLVAHVSAAWNSLDKVHELPGRNPGRAVTRNPYTPSRERLDDDAMPGWYAKVQGLENGVRRDLQMFCLFTGMRSEAARSVRWEHIDEERGALIVPKPKGGEAKAFTLPLPKTVLDMLAARKDGNRDLFAPYKGDHGWVFPTLTRDTPQKVIPVAEPKEYRLNEDTGKMEVYLPGLHTLRRTYLSVAAEAGISELDRHVLANHAFGRQSVNEMYIRQAFDHLADCQATIERALWARLKPDPEAKAKQQRKRMRAV
jgi:integrase